MERLASRILKRAGGIRSFKPSFTRNGVTQRYSRCLHQQARLYLHHRKQIPSSARSFTSKSVQYAAAGQHVAEPAELSPADYHKFSDTYIDSLVESLEELAESREDIDVEYHSGVLNLVFPPAGTYVINKQPPNRQIWLSSPISGPKRYDYVIGQSGEGEWIYLRDGSTLTGLLNEELKLGFEPPPSD